MRAAAGFHRANAFSLKRLMLGQKLAVFLRKNIVRDRRDAYFFPQPFAKLEHQRRLAAADRTTNTHCERALIEITVAGQFTVVKMAGAIGMRMAVSAVSMKMKEQSHKST